jgi:hypothetical protein
VGIRKNKRVIRFGLITNSKVIRWSENERGGRHSVKEAITKRNTSKIDEFESKTN